jgi:hypothetical protein
MAFTPTFPATAHDLAVEIADYADSQIAVVNEAALRFEEDFGAVGDNTTDDTEAFQTAVSTAGAAAISNGSYYTELRMHPKHRYLLSGTPLHGGSTKGNALIPLPVPPETGRNLIFVIKGSEDQAQHWHWNQTIRQDAGAVIRTTLSGTNDATWGPLSVMGGPTPVQGYGAVSNLWSNMTIVIDGVQIINPDNPSICGFDFGGVGRMVFKNGSVVTNAAGVGGHSSPTNGWQFGLRTPQNNNNARSEIGNYTAVAQNYGGYINEHSRVDHIIASLLRRRRRGRGRVRHRPRHLHPAPDHRGVRRRPRLRHRWLPGQGRHPEHEPRDHGLRGHQRPVGLPAGVDQGVRHRGGVQLPGRRRAQRARYQRRPQRRHLRHEPPERRPGRALHPGIYHGLAQSLLAQRAHSDHGRHGYQHPGHRRRRDADSRGRRARPRQSTSLLPTGAYITLTYSAAPAWKWMIT